jgi:hypothetical protein
MPRLPRLLSLFCLLAAHMFADGGVIQFRRESGPFLVTLFTSPAPLRSGRGDLSVLVESAKDHQPVLDAAVSIELHQNGRPAVIARATRAAATNKLLYAALPDIPTPGSWDVVISVAHGDTQVKVRGTLEILPALPAIVTYWPYFVAVPILIALFVLNQRLKARSHAARKPQYGRSPT